LCAFWANRTRLTATGGSPIDRDLNSALDKVARSLSPHMKAYLDKLASVVTSKPGAGAAGDGRAHGANIDQLVKASVDHRRVEMVYHSFTSRKVKTYTIEPHRLTFTTGGIYLYAYVPAYHQMRTFALQRIRRMNTLAETFDPVLIDDDPYKLSLGPYAGGKSEHVEVEFSPAVAPYIEEREWHKSQQLSRLDDGAVVLKLDVAVDFSLRSWILGFGHHARVLQPSHLALEMLEEFEEAREQYAPRMMFDVDAAGAVMDMRPSTLLLFEPSGVTFRSQRPSRELSAPRSTAAPRRPGARRATP
jgi:predicted DNA-binding transcriptional regulator YafY